ncbi:hypothetical protein GN956_G22868 [Arapaima gigas]
MFTQFLLLDMQRLSWSTPPPHRRGKCPSEAGGGAPEEEHLSDRRQTGSLRRRSRIIWCRSGWRFVRERSAPVLIPPAVTHATPRERHVMRESSTSVFRAASREEKHDIMRAGGTGTSPWLNALRIKPGPEYFIEKLRFLHLWRSDLQKEPFCRPRPPLAAGQGVGAQGEEDLGETRLIPPELRVSPSLQKQHTV